MCCGFCYLSSFWIKEMMQIYGKYVLLHVLAVILSAAVSSTESQPYVITRSGPIIGKTVHFRGTLLNAFLGIPYAQPPVGQLRFRRAVPVEPWCLHRAIQMPPACVQYTNRKFPGADYEPGQSEDCLYLNIWVPPNTENSDKKAVMFWIPGGGFFVGSNRLPQYDGRALAAEGDVIVVTLNFRLGALGFFVSQTNDAPGNEAFTDIIQALKWVNTNIEFFGGDKDSITPFGSSSGGWAVGLLCISPEVKGLFKRVIIESGSVSMYVTNADNQDASQRIAEVIGCASGNHTLRNCPEEVMRCMRSKSALEIMKASAAANPDLQKWLPHYGDDILPRNLREAIMAGEFQCGNMLVSHTADEGSMFLPGYDAQKFGKHGYKETPVDKSYASSFLTKFLHQFPGKDTYLEHFKNVISNDNGDLRHELYNAFGDYYFSCPDIYIAEKSAEKGNSVYFFIFGHRPSNSVFAPWTNAVHFSDVKFQFGMPLLYPQNYTSEEVRLSEKIMEIWSNFAKNGLPGEGWPQYSRRNPEFVYIDTERFGEIGCGTSTENCNVLRPYFAL